MLVRVYIYMENYGIFHRHTGRNFIDAAEGICPENCLNYSGNNQLLHSTQFAMQGWSAAPLIPLRNTYVTRLLMNVSVGYII